ncbi:hypothetical protein ACJJTC_017829 [Scirpophaga incertulas]
MSDKDRSSPSLTDTPLKTYIGRHDDDYPLINGNVKLPFPQTRPTQLINESKGQNSPQRSLECETEHETRKCGAVRSPAAADRYSVTLGLDTFGGSREITKPKTFARF